MLPDSIDGAPGKVTFPVPVRMAMILRQKWFAAPPPEVRARTNTAMASVAAVLGTKKRYAAYLCAQLRTKAKGGLGGRGIWPAAR